MEFIETRGTPRERGQQHGEALREAIPACLADYGGERPLSAIGWEIEHWLQEYAGSLHQEMVGIAEGSGVAYEQIVRHSIANALGFVTQQECTTFVVRGPDARCVMGKTQDVGGPEGRWQLVEAMTDEAGEQAVLVGLVGTVWCVCGLNEMGFAGGINSAPFPTDPQGPRGWPQHLALRPLLQREATVAGAVRQWLRTPLIGKGICGCLCDAVGDAVTFERSGFRYAVTQAVGSIHHTNHFRDPGLIAHAGRPGTEHSYRREAWLNEVLAGQTFDDPVAQAERLLTDVDGTGLICRAIDDRDHGTRSGYLADCAARTFAVWDGPPTAGVRREWALG